MADLKISQLSSLAAANVASGDLFAVVDNSSSETKKITLTDLLSATSFGLVASNAIPIAKVSVTAGSIAGTAVADLGISTAKVANDAITSDKLGNNSSAQLVTSLPGSGGFTGQIAANSNDGYAASIWDGSAWQSIKAAASINTITGDTTSIVNIAVATSGSTRTITASIDNSTAAAQFLAGPSGAAGAVSLRAITGADLPLATSSAQGSIKINGEGLRIDTGVIEIDNDVTASSAYNLVSVSAKGLVTAARVIQSSDLPAGTTSAKGALQVGTGLAVSNGTVSINNTATAGTYTKGTFDANGLLTSGTSLVAGDVPAHSAALLTSGSLDVARIAADSIGREKFSNTSTCIFGSVAQTGFPSISDSYRGELFFDTTEEDLYINDSNAWQPVTTLTKGSLKLGGVYNASNSTVTSVTSHGSSVGLTVGQNLPTPSSTTDSTYLIIGTGGTPSGIPNGPTGELIPPDYLLSLHSSTSDVWVEIDLSTTVSSPTAANVSVTSGWGGSSTNVQTALAELSSDKIGVGGGNITGVLKIEAAGSLQWEGTANDYETTLVATNPASADRTITLPDANGTVLLSGGAAIVNADVATSCALAYSKLAALASGSVLIGDGSNVATVRSISGDATLSNAGVLTIASSAITNAKISSSAAIALSKLATGAIPTGLTVTNANVVSSAAIAGTKISPDFGTQAITTSGNLTLSAQADLRLGDAAGGEYVAIQAGTTVGTSYTIELPTAVGATGKVLKSTVSGTVATLTWEDDATNVAAASLTGSTLASGVTASSLQSLGTLSSLIIDGDVTFTGASSNGLWDKSANAFVANVTGNLTGNVTGNTSGSSGSCTGNAATASLATEFTVTANNTTDETCYLLFSDAATGSQGAESDSGLTYNPSTGLLTCTSVTANLTGNVTGNASGSAGSCTGNAATATLATNANHISVADNESTNENNLIPFIEDASATGNVGLESDGDFHYNPSTGKITATTFSDAQGPVRSIPQNSQSGTYTLVAADAGKHILASGNITVPDSVFSAGMAITLVNNTGGDLTITKGTNMYNIADATNANRTLGTRGVATLLFTAADTCYISGSPLS